MDDKNKIENDEVDLRDYLNLIFSKKWSVLGVFMAAIVIAMIYNFSAPKIYEVSTWLEIGKIKENTPVESLAQIAKKAKNDIYGKYPYSINIVSSDQMDLIQIKLESSKPEKAKDDLGKLSASILIEHEGKIKTKREDLQNEIQRIQEKIVLLKQEKKSLEAKMEIPISQFDLFFLKSSLSGKDIDIEELYSKIGLLKDSLGDIQSTKIVKDPIISDTPIRPKSLINITIAGLLGLFLGICIVFGEKWWKESKD